MTSRNSFEARRIVEEMATQDMNVAITAKGRMDLMMEELHAMNEATADKLDRVTTVNKEIDARVADAVRSLQFADGVNQLVSSTHNRVDRLVSLVTAMRQNLGQLQAVVSEDRLD